MKLLAIGAHPDDIEFGCGGILVKEAEKGSQIKILVLSKGEAGSVGTPEERAQESRNAAKLIGAEIEFLNFGSDCHIQYTPQNAITIARQIREFKPEIVLTCQPDENQHPDHSAVGKNTRDAARFARYGGLVELKDLPVHKISGLYYYFVTQAFSQNPQLIIDVTDVHKKWEQTMACHKTQMQGKEYLTLINFRAAALGAAIGTQYAVGLWGSDPIRVDNISDLNLSSRNY